jgi:hypothetical protein
MVLCKVIYKSQVIYSIFEKNQGNNSLSRKIFFREKDYLYEKDRYLLLLVPKQNTHNLLFLLPDVRQQKQEFLPTLIICIN